MNAFPKALDALGNVKICGFFPQIFDLVCGFFPQMFDNFPVRCYSISENKRIETCVRS